MTKVRGFSIVLHDVHKGTQAKADVQAKLLTLKWRQYVIAEEPYNHQDGSHIHIFLQVHNPVHFSAMLKFWCCWWKSGRVQVDAMRGSMAQATDYINDDRGSKDKAYDPEPIIFLEGQDAEAAQVETKVVTRQDLISFWCPECMLVPDKFDLFCKHYIELTNLHYKCFPLPPQRCIHKSEYKTCRHPDCVRSRTPL
nr:MAG: hypothetical protein [Skomarfal virus 29]